MLFFCVYTEFIEVCAGVAEFRIILVTRYFFQN
ncbi:MAG: hypothetical protein UW92_C0021G0009 [Candidatus Jorgensenbacteria bacterium GW2011_GWA2_45_13]|uniref:Uncharacterized protein n=1 Tax=Candidatus Jorgensenbacteria bacterium GW2011_GWA2_45_13 TaxID=1618662 RepID=A0A0G1L4R8_9BACT|nr:MAG: hypothetical protein UW92_C0021G0009 [Candidatus Jorgensenbacteria bacterium GW2011_GWA2_45_13]